MLSLAACNKNRIVDGDRPDTAGISTPPAPSGKFVSYMGSMPEITFIQIEKGGDPRSQVFVYVQLNGVNVWQQIPPSNAVGVGSGQLCYAYDLGGGFGPVVRFMNTKGIVTAYYIYLVLP